MIRATLAEAEPTGFDAIRIAGRVKRYHTVPGCDQSIAAHSWGVAMILVTFFPPVSAALLQAALIHDLPEMETGDIPANFKWADPSVVASLNDWEDRWYDRNLAFPELSEGERRMLKVADSLELMVYCYEERCLGNLYAARPFWRVAARLPERILPPVEPLYQDLMRRMSRFDPQRPDTE